MMRVNVGHGWVDMGPGSSSGSFLSHGSGVTGHHSPHLIGLSADPLSPSGMPQAQKGMQCPICQQPTPGGRIYCSTAHAKMGFGDRHG